MSPLLVAVIAVLVAVLLLRLARWYKNNVWRWHTLTKHMPGPPAYPIVGAALSVALHPDKLFERMQLLWRTYGSTIRLWLGPQLFVVVMEPDDVEVSRAQTL